MNKKERITNAWLIAPELSPSEMSKGLDASYEYVRRTTKSLREGEISDREISKMIDIEVQEEIWCEFSESGFVDKSKFEPITEPPLQRKEKPSKSRGEKKKYIINSWLLGLDVSTSSIAEVIGSSYEYTRRVIKQLEEGEIDEEEIKEHSDNEIQDELRQEFESKVGLELSLSSISVDTPANKIPATQKQMVANVWSGKDGNIDHSVAANIIGCSEEYVRRIVRDIEEGKIEIENTTHEQLEKVLWKKYDREMPKDSADYTQQNGEIDEQITDLQSDQHSVEEGYSTVIRDPTSHQSVPKEAVVGKRSALEELLAEAEYQMEHGNDGAEDKQYVAQRIIVHFTSLINQYSDEVPISVLKEKKNIISELLAEAEYQVEQGRIGAEDRRYVVQRAMYHIDDLIKQSE